MRQEKHLVLCHMGLTNFIFTFTWDLQQVVNAFPFSLVKRGDTFLLSSGLPCLVPQSPWIQAFTEMKNIEKLLLQLGLWVLERHQWILEASVA